MKLLHFLLFLALFVSPVCAQKTEEEAIKKVIMDESDAFLAGDANKVRTYYNFQPYAWGTVTFASGVSLHETGEAFSKFYDRIKPNPNVTAKQNDYVFKINGNQAWVTNVSRQTNKTDNTSAQSNQLRCLEKINGDWKIVALSSHPITPARNATTSNSDEEAIKTLITAELESFKKGNLEEFMAHHAQVPYLLWTVTNGMDPGDVLTYRGYDAFKEFVQNLPWFKNYKPTNDAPKPDMNVVTRDKWNIQFRGNIAYVTYNEHNENAEKQTKVDGTVTKIVEKINGQWKIVLTSALMDFKDATPPIRSKY